MVLVICAVKDLFFDLTSFVSKVIVDLVRDTYLESKTMISAPSQSQVDKRLKLKTTLLTLHHLHAKIMSISKNLLGLGAAITELSGTWKPK